MTRTSLVTLVLAVVVTAAAAAGQGQNAPVFRSTATVVSVSASVKRFNAPVSGLAASDFLLTDNGVEQTIDSVAFEEVPIDATLIIDVSGSTEDVVDRIRRDTRRILALLRPIDRARVLAIDTYVHEILPLQSAEKATLPPQPAVGGMSSISDAIAMALMTPPDPDRRRLIVAMTDGVDTMSVLDAGQVREIARRSDVVLHVVAIEASMRAPSMLRRPDAVYTSPLMLSRASRPETVMLGQAAEATGGRLHDPQFSRDDPVGAFRTVFEEFRRSYVLRYSPTGVPLTGWHELSLTVKGNKATEVRARKGYFGG
jgi:VWFA-related protein